MAHKLAIEVQDGTNDNRYLTVSDFSVYDEILPIKRRKLQVLPPFSDEYVELAFAEFQINAFTTDSLKLTCGVIDDIPDGQYVFHYSIAPNDLVFVYNYHFRVARLRNAVLSKMMLVSVECNAAIDECGNIEINKYQNMLLHIWMLLNGAQAAGKNSLTSEAAKELYAQANKAFDKLYKIDNCKMC